MSYGRHQSFYLKKHWINKGLKSLEYYGLRVLFESDKYKKLGIGKNMHQALRYWMEATNIVEFDAKNKLHIYTDFGEIIKEYDSGCTLPLTILLLHYYLTKDNGGLKDTSVTFNWFFQKYNEERFSKEKIRDDLLRFNRNETSENTLNKDIDCMLQSYVKKSLKHPEDKNVCIFQELGLLKKHENIYVKSPLNRKMYDFDFFMFVFLAMKKEGVDLTFENIMHHASGIGKNYNLNRSEVIEIIETMSKEYNIEITRTNNLNTVVIKDNKDAFLFLKEAYMKRGEI
jgi:hypothetical protein